ncbi:hypothetical protein O6V14_02980 [Sphingomonas faeni]|uniref:hypothetical protein n=1 Tax=Sphingomonas faeni TaxID=185950 RepID=UPI00334B3F12
MTFSVGDRVVDGVGDRGTVRKLGQPGVQNAQTFIYADPAKEGPTFTPGPATVLVEWETLNGVEISKQGSWEDVGDLAMV